MANKNFDFWVRYVDPDEADRTTPAKRRERVAGPYSATSVERALTKFYKDVCDLPDSEPHSTHAEVWLKKDIYVLDVMRPANARGDKMPEDEDSED